MVMEARTMKGGLWGYYRQPNGWITISIITPIERLNYIEEGWVHLRQYGLVEMNNKYSVDYPLEALFLAGGAKELPLDQIQAMGFHIYPPVLPGCGQRLQQYHKVHDADCWATTTRVVFPQLEGIELPTFPCRFCEVVQATEQGRTNHETIAHKEAQGEIRMGTTMAEAMAKGLQGAVVAANPAPENVDSLMADVAALRQELEDMKTSRGSKTEKEK